MEVAMFLSILILIFLLPFIFLPLTLDTFFSSNELNEMGIYMENLETTSPLPLTKPGNIEVTCQLWNIAEQVAA